MVKITALPQAFAIGDADRLPIVQGDATRVASIAGLFAGYARAAAMEAAFETERDDRTAAIADLASYITARIDSDSEFAEHLFAAIGNDPNYALNVANRFIGLDNKAATTDTRVAVVATAAAPLTVGFQEPIFRDRRGLLGVGERWHVPTRGYVQQGDTIENFTDPVRGNSPLPGYSTFSFPPGSIGVLYYDLDKPDGAVIEAALYPDIPNFSRVGRAQILASTWNGRVISDLPIVNLDGEYEARIAPTIDPIVVDGSSVLIPSLFYVAPDVFPGYNLFQPDNAAFWEFGVSPSEAEERRYYFDAMSASAGNAAVKVATGADAPLIGDLRHVMLATSIGGRVRASPGQQIVSTETGGVVRSQWPFGRDVLGIPPARLWPQTYVTEITDPTAMALGFTRGLTAPQGQQIYVSVPFVQPRNGDLVFVRIYVWTDSDDGYGVDRAQRLYFQDASGGTIGTGLPMRAEKRHAARLKSFIWTGPLPTGAVAVNVGMEGLAGHSFTVAGVQAASAPDARWISRADYPGRASATAATSCLGAALADSDPESLVVGPDLWTVTGRELAIYPPNLFADKLECSTAITTLSSIAGTRPYIRTGRDQLVIAPERLGTSADLTVRHLRSSARRYRMPLRVHVAPATLTGSPKILVQGDSLSRRKRAQFLKQRLEEAGVTPVFVGTVQGQDANGGDTGPLGEGREGWKYADFVYRDMRYLPVPVGGEAEYLAGSLTLRATRNPFIRPAILTGANADPADRIVNGYVFDLSFYFARFNIAKPDFMLISLGTNDVNLTPTVALANVREGVRLMRAAAIAAGISNIAFGMHARPRSADGDSDARLRRDVIAATLAAGADVIPYWQHMSAEWGWAATGLATNVETHTEVFGWSDTVHFEDLGRRQVAECDAAYVMCKLAGV